MDQLRKMIIDAIYERWCEMDFPKTRMFTGTDLNTPINDINHRFHAKGKDALYVESTITAIVCEREEYAFKDGFYLCLELLNGNIFKNPLK